MKKLTLGTLCLLFVFVLASKASPKLIINEIMSSNGVTSYDEDGDTSDWLELYNPNDEPLSLKDWRISDKNKFSKAWVLPDTILPAKSYLRIFCSEKDRTTKGYRIIEASGASLYDNPLAEAFHFEYIKINGDVEMSLDCVYLRNIALQSAFVALTVREDLQQSSRYAGMFFQRGPKFSALYRDTLNTPYKIHSFKPLVNDDHVYLKLRRFGDTVRLIYTDKGGHEYDYYDVYFPSNKELYAGIAMSTSYGLNLGEFILDTFKFNGKPYNIDNLTSYDIVEMRPSRKFISNELHTNFALNKDGETVFLWNPDGELSDSIATDTLIPDVSYGSYPDGAAARTYFDQPTDSKSNKNPKVAILKTPIFSEVAGLYKDSIRVSLATDEKDTKIVYSIDGSDLTVNSLQFTQPLIFYKNTCIKVRAFKDNFVPSPTVSSTYFINDTASLPSVSMVSDSMYLWKKPYGILYSIYDPYVAPANFELFSADKKRIYSGTGEIEISGNSNARNIMGHSSLRINAKEKYGMKNFDYAFWGANSLDEYKTLVFRNSSNDWSGAFMRDAFGCMLARRISTLDAALSQPYFIYINGEFYALADLREHTNENYFKIKYNISEESINIIKNNSELNDGNGTPYFSLIDSLQTINDFNSKTFTDLINSKIDIDNILDYVILETYSSNYDWITNNLKIWQSDEYDSKWRFVVYDLDWSLDIGSTASANSNLFDRFLDSAYNPNNKFAYLFGKIISNDEFKLKYIMRSQDLLNSVLSPKPVRQLLDSMAYFISLGINRQRAKFPECAKDWAASVDRIRVFAEQRNRYLMEDYVNRFGLKGLTTIKINSNNNSEITVKVNNNIFKDSSIVGYYFKDYEVKVQALSQKGQKFVGWMPDSLGADPNITLKLDTLRDTINITAIFEKLTDTNLVINEIMYKSTSDRDCDDWVELYNPKSTDIDISKWVMKDNSDGHNFTFPDPMILKAHSYIVLCEDTAKFRNCYDATIPIIGNFDFGLGEIDEVRIYDNFGELVDSVSYTNVEPWENAYNTGFSLELNNPIAYNNEANNWHASSILGGTPGAINSKYDPSAFITDENIINATLKLHPNPVSDRLYLQYNSLRTGEKHVILYGIAGHIIKELATFYYDGKQTERNIDINNVAQGVYLLVISDSNGNTEVVEQLEIVR